MRAFFIFFILWSLTSGCVSQPIPQENKSYEKVFRVNFDTAWRATQQAMISYPLKINNMEQGLIETTSVRSQTYFKPPHLEKKHAGGFRYNLNLHLIKETDKITKVSIQKNLSVYRDFISQPEDLISDGLEEKALLYRIQREIELEKTLNETKTK